MPLWTSGPPDAEANYTYRLARTPPNRPVKATILSTKMIGTRTHFFHGRTSPCEAESCEACQEGLPWRWHGYLAVLTAEKRERVILELTAQAADQLTGPTISYGTLRGIEIILERPSRRPNGRVIIHWRMGATPPDQLPAAPDVTLIMRHIWGLDDANMVPDPNKNHRGPQTVQSAIDQLLPKTPGRSL